MINNFCFLSGWHKIGSSKAADFNRWENRQGFPDGDKRANFLKVYDKQKSLTLVLSESVDKVIFFQSTLILEGPYKKCANSYLESRAPYIQKSYQDIGKKVVEQGFNKSFSILSSIKICWSP